MIRGGMRVMTRSDTRSNRPAIEIADILRRHGDAYRRVHAGHLGRVARRVMSAIVACGTEALGGHMEACDDCRTPLAAYNSCSNRHCPKCQGPARAAWLAAREADLLPVHYFHVVFTLPAPIAAIAFQNKGIVYAILFKAAAEAMSTLAANPRRLGAGIGIVAVLHTWGQALTHHPHVHCVVPGGGLSPDSARWIASGPNFFLAVKPLARLFRRLFLERLTAAFDAGTLNFFGDLASLAEPAAFAPHLVAMRRISWVVYAKRPFGGPAQVLAYLGRYLNPFEEEYNERLDVTTCLIGFNFDGFAKVAAVDPKAAEAEFTTLAQAELVKVAPKLAKALTDKGLATQPIEIFFLPLPSVSDFRDLF